MLDDLLEGFEIFPGFKTPSNSGSSRDILEYIDSEFPQVRPRQSLRRGRQKANSSQGQWFSIVETVS